MVHNKSQAQKLEALIQKNCLTCGIELLKKPKQSYAQFERMRYCSHSCNGKQLKGRRSKSGNTTSNKQSSLTTLSTTFTNKL